MSFADWFKKEESQVIQLVITPENVDLVVGALGKLVLPEIEKLITTETGAVTSAVAQSIETEVEKVLTRLGNPVQTVVDDLKGEVQNSQNTLGGMLNGLLQPIQAIQNAIGHIPFLGGEHR